MVSIFGMFGRSHELQRFDRALRGAGLHPRLVPEAVKLTIQKLLGEVRRDPAPYDGVAELLSYCMLGARGFTEANDPRRTQAVEARLTAALEASVSLDAQIVLLTLHAGVIQPSVVERYALEAG